MKPESLSEKLMFNTVRLETELGMGTLGSDPIKKK